MAKLKELAHEAFKNSYSPYSHFKVGAAVVMKGGSLFSGCNVENASYGATVCAERNALFQAVSKGHKELEAILILTDQEHPWPPCGMCRQVMLEFGSPETKVFTANLNGTLNQFTLGQLCPESFTPGNLS
ncbi:MAG: cytidine deaminase [Bdellovibrionales bacterium]|nr:cytidine deaminase [Bdellovibrionales bacterium]